MLPFPLYCYFLWFIYNGSLRFIYSTREALLAALVLVRRKEIHMLFAVHRSFTEGMRGRTVQKGTVGKEGAPGEMV